MKFNKTRRHQKQKGGDRITDILTKYKDDQFFKYLFFDPYIQNGKGSVKFSIALKFWNYITTSIPDSIPLFMRGGLTEFFTTGGLFDNNPKFVKHSVDDTIIAYGLFNTGIVGG
jgi:hypothetical protein